MDLSVIHDFISGSYWARNIPRDLLVSSIENSLCVGVLTTGDEQVGFARLITDKATFAYMADLFILEDHRGKGLGKWLVKYILELPEMQGLRRILLVTEDAHGLYRRFGFENIANPKIFMELRSTDIYMQHE
ncbi:MAG: GNAT family N-acetyltransferase [Gammaproteobacteria bacterium]|nr:GNAT family N-acetyltransferase [Gammaproteobacteria bacterium]